MTDDPGKKLRDLADDLTRASQAFISGQPADAPPDPPVEKGVKMRGRQINGAQWVRAIDVADLLALNNVLPNAEKVLRRSIS